MFVTAAIGIVFQVSRYTTFGVNTDIEEKSNTGYRVYRSKLPAANAGSGSARFSYNKAAAAAESKRSFLPSVMSKFVSRP